MAQPPTLGRIGLAHRVRARCPVTTVSAMMGHANPSFTLACYGRDPRDTETMVADVLARAAAAGYLTRT